MAENRKLASIAQADEASLKKQTVGGSWSMLKNAAKTTISSAASLDSNSAGVNEKSNAADSFLKYKMQLLEKEKMLREQESMKAQREKDNLKYVSVQDFNWICYN